MAYGPLHPHPQVFRSDAAKPAHPCKDWPLPLAGSGRVRGCEIRIGCRPDTAHTTNGAKKQSRWSQTDERQKQRVLDQILTLLVVQKSHYLPNLVSPPNTLQNVNN